MMISPNCEWSWQLIVLFGILLSIISMPLPKAVFSLSDYHCNSRDHQEPITIKFVKQAEKEALLALPPKAWQSSIWRSSQIQQSSSSTIAFHEIGDQRLFWVYNFSTSSYYEINASLLAIGEHSYIFIDNICIAEAGEPTAMALSETICDEFDSTIYPRVTDLAGHPDGTLGDIDGNPRIIILFTRNRVNYYSPVNEFPLDYSNQCEMIYLYYRSSMIAWHLATVAHEFHHLIWFNHEMDEAPFILEALAQYAEYYAGYLEPWDNIEPRVASFLRKPGESLLCWNSEINYGSAYLFAFYNAEHYGIKILRSLITEPADGPHGVEAVLQAAGYDITFNELYLNWITAVTIDEPNFQNKLFCFEKIDARVSSYDRVDDLPLLNETITLYYYGFHVHKVQSPPNSFAIQIRKPSNQAIGLSVAMHDIFGWHNYQSMHDEADILITKNFSSSSIEVAYIITSFLLKRTPIISTDARGLNSSIVIEISIVQPPISSEGLNSGLFLPLLALVGISLPKAMIIAGKLKKA